MAPRKKSYDHISSSKSESQKFWKIQNRSGQIYTPNPSRLKFYFFHISRFMIISNQGFADNTNVI